MIRRAILNITYWRCQELLGRSGDHDNALPLTAALALHENCFDQDERNQHNGTILVPA